jgi:cell division protein ZapE
VTTEPLQRYRQLLSEGAFLPDQAQHDAVIALDELWHELVAADSGSGMARLFRREPRPVKGLYLWGGVGRGKTWLMDLFFDSLPLQRKQRIHFHRFMARVHEALRERASASDPLPDIAREWARHCRVLCFDEFFISDIADAMLMAGLLKGLFDNGVTLIATSNLPPGELYRDGLQRARFLPAIDLISQHTRILQVCGDTDFRLRLLERSEIYHHPLDEAAETVMAENFQRMADCSLPTKLLINQRGFSARQRGDGIIWFDFDELCNKPRGANDFIEIARSFNTVFLSGVPVMDRDSPDAARRFITLVDEFYDHNVKLLISAAASIPGLYTGDKLAFEFERTASRLVEMQSHEYLARPHLP